MKLYLLSQDEVNGYEVFTSMVVAGETAEEAKKIHPSNSWGSNDWASTPEQVTAIYLGEAASTVERGVICASNTGA